MKECKDQEKDTQRARKGERKKAKDKRVHWTGIVLTVSKGRSALLIDGLCAREIAHARTLSSHWLEIADLKVSMMKEDAGHGTYTVRYTPYAWQPSCEVATKHHHRCQQIVTTKRGDINAKRSDLGHLGPTHQRTYNNRTQHGLDNQLSDSLSLSFSIFKFRSLSSVRLRFPLQSLYQAWSHLGFGS